MTTDPELQKLINIRSARGWKPAPGQTLVGTIVDIRKQASEYGEYPVLTVAAEGDDPEATEYTAVHAFHGTLKTALYELKPSKGQRLAITYGGQSESRKRKDSNGDPVKYHVYTVLDPDAAVQTEDDPWATDDPQF